MSDAASPATGRWWLSWYEPTGHTEDYRPRKWPLPRSIPAYWCTGWRISEDDASALVSAAYRHEAILCAIVDAPNESAARRAVTLAGWSPSEWRFCEAKAKDWWPPTDRFPRAP
jgi:hypothetical protein